MAKNNKEKSQKISTILEILNRLKDSYLFTEVLGWLFIFLSIFTVISDLDKGGVLGNYYKDLMIQIFGISHFGLILLFLFLGISWLLRFNINWKISTSFALLILFLTFSTFSEIVFQDGGIIGKWLLSLKII
jgi:hypothetical protein